MLKIYMLIMFKYLIYGSSVFFTGRLTEAVDVLDVIALRFLMSFAVFLLLRVLKIIKTDFRHKPIKPLLFAALFEPVLYFFFETMGISRTTTLTAGIIIAFTPVVTCAAGSLILKEKTTLLQKLFLLSSVCGVMLIICMTKTTGGENTPFGIVCMFLAILSGAFFCVFSRQSSKCFSAIEITYFSSILGAFVFNTINFLRHIALGTLNTYFSPYMKFDNLIGFFFLSVLSTIAATCANNYVLSKIPVSRAASFGGISTLITIAEGVIFNHEHLYVYHIVGVLLILGGVYGVNKFSKNNGKAV